MLLTKKQCKWLETNDDGSFVFIGKTKASEEELQELQELDESYLFITGKHLIENYRDLYK